MKEKITLRKLAKDPGCLAEYDPNAMEYQDAIKWIRQFIEPVKETQIIPIRESLGRVLSEDIYSPIDVPNYNNSAMDGFVFYKAQENSPIMLEVIGSQLAGQSSNEKVLPGQAIQIMTGARIPNGGNTVIPIELVSYDGDKISINESPKIGANIRKIGEDVKKNELILKKGRCIRSSEIGLLASLGLPKVSVYRQIRVAFFSTGDEVVEVGSLLKVGQVYDSNNHTIGAMLERIGAEIVNLRIVSDDKNALKKTLLSIVDEVDVIITSGGVSVGAADFMKEVLKEIGEVLFWKLSIKPGRPLAYGKINQTHYFGLPGNPVASMVSFYQIVQPQLKVLMGEVDYELPPLFKVKTEKAIHKKPGRMEFQRGILFKNNDEWWVKPTGHQGSAILSSMSQANCFIVMGIHEGSIDSGDTVKVQLMEGFI
jgi:molybdopterin molybdotransferase